MISQRDGVCRQTCYRVDCPVRYQSLGARNLQGAPKYAPAVGGEKAGPIGFAYSPGH